MYNIMATDLTKFRKVLTDLTDSLHVWLPEKTMQIEKYKMQIDLAMKINPRGTVEVFIDSIKDHADAILQGDDTYFQNEDIDLKIEEEYSHLADEVRHLWVTFNDEQKTAVKKYFQLLLMLGVLVTKDTELLAIINKYRTNPLSF